MRQMANAVFAENNDKSVVYVKSIQEKIKIAIRQLAYSKEE
jgi:hypothetical protein